MAACFAQQSPLHVALIPDGNGRWAVARGLSRALGHRAGVEAVRRAVRSASDFGIGTLTIHALSRDNWGRPYQDVRAILGCVAQFLDSEKDAFTAGDVRVSIIGRRDRLPPDVLRAIETTETATAGGRGLHLRLAVDYSARNALARAIACAAQEGDEARLVVARELGSDVDLLVRTGGEQRLSDFLLWECAYAELYFVPVLWPDFGPEDLAAAVAEFHRRERRFGKLPPIPASGTQA